MNAITQGKVCCNCYVEFSPSETTYPVFSQKPNSKHWGDHSARCGTCARARGVISALNDHAASLPSRHHSYEVPA